VLDNLRYEDGGYYIIDRAYIDFVRFRKINDCHAFFVTRAKDNLKFKRQYSQKVRKETGVQYDQIGVLTGFYARQNYPGKLRLIKYFDDETKNEFVFLSNNFSLSAEEISQLYKQRWKVELFFKWIKQHLKIKAFWGTTYNAVRIQVYSAIITYCLVSLVRSKLKLTNRTTYEILQILSISLLDKTSINELLKNQRYKDVKEPYCNQLKISWI
jgi:IS4 transposase